MATDETNPIKITLQPFNLVWFEFEKSSRDFLLSKDVLPKNINNDFIQSL